MKKNIVLFSIILISTLSFGQNLFPIKIENCNLSKFCLDCGNPKANYDKDSFSEIINSINSKYNFSKSNKGMVGVQVIIDSIGRGCVLSHTDQTKSPLTKDLIKMLNNCKWVSAKDKGKKVSSSINLIFEIKKNKLIGKVIRVDTKAMSKNMKNPGEPEIYNKTYKYKNESLSTYNIEVLQKENSELPNDMSTTSLIDKVDNLWYATYGGLIKYNGNKIKILKKSNSPFKKTESVSAIGADFNNNIWISTNKTIYKFKNEKWKKIDSITTGINGAFNIISNKKEVLFSSNKGLLIYKNEKWNLITDKVIKQLPSNRVYYAFRDKKERLWIGTFKGSIMIDENNKVTEFNKTKTPINKICISDATEDEYGNIYFALFAYEKSKNRNRSKEGFAIFTNKGKWIHYNDTNSGLPANHINSILYDKFEKVLWIGTNEAGLVRFDLKNEWENYHNLNSKVPSSYIFDLSQDSKGNIYASTFNGLLLISKK